MRGASRSSMVRGAVVAAAAVLVIGGGWWCRCRGAEFRAELESAVVVGHTSVAGHDDAGAGDDDGTWADHIAAAGGGDRGDLDQLGTGRPADHDLDNDPLGIVERVRARNQLIAVDERVGASGDEQLAGGDEVRARRSVEEGPEVDADQEPATHRGAREDALGLRSRAVTLHQGSGG